MALLIIRSFILYVTVIFAMRLMGKRQLGELQPTELVIAFMISDLASVPMQSKDISLLDGIIPIFTLVVSEIIFSFLIMKSRTVRKLFSGSPESIIKNGKIIEKNLERLRINTDDLLEQLRLSGYYDLNEIHSAMLETNGQISIIPKSTSRPLTPNDMNISPDQEKVSFTIIADGKMRKNNLSVIGVDEKWVYKTLSSYNIKDIKSVLLLVADEDKKIFLQIRD